MVPEPFEARVQMVSSVPVIELHGEINADAGTAMKEAYESAATGAVVVLDFTHVSYINSTGIAHIIGLLATARAAANEVRACGLSDHYREIFEITRVADFMKLYEDRTDALQGIPPP